MHRLSVGGDQDQVVSLDGELRGTHRSERVDHPEPVSSSWSHGEDFQRCVGHESGVGVSELSFAVDEQAFGVLTGVDGQSSWESLGGVFVHPVAEQHHVRGQVVVVQVAVGVLRWGLADHDAAVQTVHLLEAGVSVPEVGSGVARQPLVPETWRL
jgi:hypothetical protein